MDAIAPEGGLLAVDLGLRTGLARYGRDGRLAWYRSSHVGDHARLKRAAEAVLREAAPLDAVVLEGDRRLGDLWERAAERRGLRTLRVTPEAWRERLLLPRDRRSGADAKRRADSLARAVIAWSGARRPTSLRHDAAEAILIGLWGALTLGWLEELPPLG